jgi:hypothetical protein
LVFWFFTYDVSQSSSIRVPTLIIAHAQPPEPRASISFCSPTISLRNVLADVAIPSGNVTALKDLGPLTPSSNYSSLSGNVSALAGAYNGISFPFANVTTDPFVFERGNATRFVLPAAIFQAAQVSGPGLDGTFDTDGFLGLSTTVYVSACLLAFGGVALTASRQRTFLSLVAKSVYFLSSQEPIYTEVITIRKRLFLR